MDEYYKELIATIIKEKLSKDKVTRLKLKLCSKHKLKRPPTDIQILIRAEEKDLPKLRVLQTKPTRTISGVSVVAVMTKPHKCPHGKCITCPGGIDSYFGDVPQSYTGNEPATMRGIRNKFSAYLQVFNRLQQYALLGHNFDKVEMIIMGGTFLSTPKKYQDSFVTDCYQAMNDFGKKFFSKGVFKIGKFKEFFELPAEVGNKPREKRLHKKILAIKKKTTLEKEQKKNESSQVRCVALALETRPDYCKEEHIKQMRRLGCTRVELGVQSVYDGALTTMERGHDVNDSIIATKLMKDALMKVGYHMMPGLPGSNYFRDRRMFKILFDDENFKPDALKIYPCMVMPGTKLFEMYKEKKYTPISTAQAAKLIADVKQFVPKYCRIMRVQRDIPTSVTSAGVDRTNLRQYVMEILHQKGEKCNCIRCREPRKKEISWKDVKLNIMPYPSSGAIEYFISFDDMLNDILIGFLRLRINGEEAGVRELHVYGQATALGKTGKVQHKGFGKKLMKEAEKLAKKHKCKTIKVISGIGVRGYYKKLGYSKKDTYMVKKV